jgi:hypothetical protein
MNGEKFSVKRKSEEEILTEKVSERWEILNDKADMGKNFK